MKAKRILKWIFEAPDDVIWPEEFEAWEKEQNIKDSVLSEEKSRELYEKIMERAKNV